MAEWLMNLLIASVMQKLEDGDISIIKRQKKHSQQYNTPEAEIMLGAQKHFQSVENFQRIILCLGILCIYHGMFNSILE